MRLYSLYFSRRVALLSKIKKNVYLKVNSFDCFSFSTVLFTHTHTHHTLGLECVLAFFFVVVLFHYSLPFMFMKFSAGIMLFTVFIYN